MKKRTKALLATSSAIAGMYLFNRILFKTTPKLESVLDGERDFYQSRFGKVFYVKNGEGEPLLFIHGIATGASSFMWRKNYEELAKDFTVYAIDLPGFGKSDKMPITYKAEMFLNVIASFIKDVIGEPTNVIAGSQAAAYAVEIECRNPGTMKKIIGVCPTGIFELSNPPRLKERLLTTTIKTPVLGTFVYNMMVSKAPVRYYLKNQTYYNKDLASTYVVNHYNKASRQNGSLSKFATASFLGKYTNLNIINSLPLLDCPFKVIWGENSKMNEVNNLKSFLDLNPNIEYNVIPKSGYMPYEEHPTEFNNICREFLK